jgi:hypothetical protein
MVRFQGVSGGAALGYTSAMLRRAPILLLVLAAALAGCKSPRPAPNPFEIDRAEYTRIFEAAQLVLHEEGFALGRRDYRFGIIETVPKQSPTIFEILKPDNTTAGQAVVATVNSQRRIVVITLEPGGGATTRPATQPATGPADLSAQADTYRLCVEVQIQQHEVPARQLSGSSTGYRTQTKLQEMPIELRDRGITESYWHTVDHDSLLEQRLLIAIVRRSTRVK